MLASFLLDTCLKAGIDFFTGVPDSLLKGLCNELYARYGTDTDTHVVAHNEGGAIALCAGHYLASGRPGLCYMQNSGLGNAVNPLSSLMDPDVYAMPCLLVIGWRGEPGVKDEPLADFEALMAEMKLGKTAAFVVRKGALKASSSPSYGNPYTMTRENAAAVILAASSPDDIFVSTTGKLSREVFELREARGEDHSRDFLTVGSMGHAGMIALRIASEKETRRVWCLDGDGACLMHLGALPVIARRLPSNLVHIVINNGAHETVGGMPVCCGSMNIPAIASAAGYPVVRSADSEEQLGSVLSECLSSVQGPVLIEVKCACGSREDLGRPTTTPIQNRDAFMDNIR